MPMRTGRRERAPPQQVFGHRLFVLLDHETEERVALVVPAFDVQAEGVEALLQLREICGTSRKNSSLA